MPDRRSLRLDLSVTVLFILGLLVALSVFSYDPADSPSRSVYPPHPHATNLLGFPGAWIASRLYDALGIAVYVLLASWLVVTLMLFLRQRLLTWLLRLAGWLLLLPTIAVLGDSADPPLFSLLLRAGRG